MNTDLAGSVCGRGFDEELAQRRALSPWLAGCTFEDAGQGRSGARVIRVVRPGRGDAYLKYATADGAREIVDEYERTRWLAARIRVPEIIAFDSTSDAAFLLTEALTGRNAADAATDDARTVVAGMAHALRGLHSIPSGDCPFDAGLRLRLASALARMDGGMVDEEDFDEPRRGMRARDVYGRMMALLSDGEARLAVQGCRVAWLACAIGNDRAARFYEKNGWVLAGNMINELQTPKGVFPLEVWRYEKALNRESSRPAVGVAHVVMHTDRMTECAGARI